MKSQAWLIVSTLVGVGVGCAVAAAPSIQPPAGAAPAGSPLPATQPAAPTTAPSALSDVHVNQEQIDKLDAIWRARVEPHRKALQEAAEAHYKVMSELRHEQQRLIDEADKIQRAIDRLEKEYQDMTTPRPEAQ